MGNKSDLFDDEEVTEVEGKEFADKIGAVFSITSALRGIGIEDLFRNLGKKLLNPNYEVDKNENDNGKGRISISATGNHNENIGTHDHKGKKPCCLNN